MHLEACLKELLPEIQELKKKFLEAKSQTLIFIQTAQVDIPL